MTLGKRSLLLAVSLFALVGAVAVPALASRSNSAMPGHMVMAHAAGTTHAKVSATADGSSVAPVDHVTIYIFKRKAAGIFPAPDGKLHDMMVPSTWSVRVGVWTQVTVVNYDNGDHTINIPQLNLDEVIQAGTKIVAPVVGKTPWQVANGVIPTTTSFIFRAPTAGIFAWYCEIPCDGGIAGVSYAMTPTNAFGMTGYIVAA